MKYFCKIIVLGAAFTASATLAAADPLKGYASASGFVMNPWLGTVITTTPEPFKAGTAALSSTVTPSMAATVDNVPSTNFLSTSLASSAPGVTSTFAATPSALGAAVAPEPSSLILMGTGLLSAAGMLLRRRRVV